ncbi:MAG: S16 family serine protease [Myxococcaceae bacterium]
MLRPAVLLLSLSLASAHAAPPAQREATVQIALVDKTASLTARIAPNRAHVPSVGVMEEVASGTGDQWLTTLWQAVFVSTQATGTSPLDFEFTLRVGGPIDGPSAGLLTASTLAALLKNKKVLPATSVTGALNPDGSVGPVSGVVERLRAAGAAGIKRFGFPVGARQQADASGAVVDLLVEGQKLGVEVKELASIDEAYAFLTGDSLARGAAATEAEMELWPAELAGLSRITAQVKHEFEEEKAQAGELAAPAKALLERLARTAEDFAKNGDTVRSLVVWSSALTTLRAAVQDAKLSKLLDAQDQKSVLEVLAELEKAIPLEREALRTKLNAQFPASTRANDVYAMDILESVVTQGRALRASATAKELSTAEGDPARVRRIALSYAEDLLRLREDLKNGERYVALYASLPPLKKPKPAVDAEGLARWYVSAGAASVASLKTRASDSAFEKDPVWLDVVGYGELLGRETDARARLILAARQTLDAAALINTFDALGAQVDAKGVLSLRNTRALGAQLEQARLRVFQSCGQAKQALGIIPFPARMRFLNARAAREGNDQQKVDALSDLWVANWWCEFAAREKK